MKEKRVNAGPHEAVFLVFKRQPKLGDTLAVNKRRYTWGKDLPIGKSIRATVDAALERITADHPGVKFTRLGPRRISCQTAYPE